ncbi:MAG: sodium:solute symporter [bacterium]|nr:sodium:solute symporter [bacterium]
MSYFGTIDYVFMGLYVLVLIGLGLYLKGRASNSLEDYIIGGRKIPWWAMGISGMAQFLDLTGTALIVSFLFMLGPQGLFIEFRGGAVLVLVFMLLWAGKWTRRSGCLTGAEWNIFRFGDCWGGRFAQLISVLAISLTTMGMLAYLTKGVGLFLSAFLPFSPDICAYGLIALAALYTMVSGFYGVIFTDLFQGGIILVAVVYIVAKAFMTVSGSSEVAEAAMHVTNNADWLSCVPKWKTSMPKGYEQYTPLIPLMIFYMFRNVIHGVGNIGDPKYLGAKTDRECGKLTALWTMMMTFRWPMMMGIAVLGLFLVQGLFPDMGVVAQAGDLIHQHCPDVTQQEWGALISDLANNPDKFAPELIDGLKSLLGSEQYAEKLGLLSFEGTINPEKVLPSVLLITVGQGLRGLLVLALIAASMSTFDSTVNMATGMVVNDFYLKYLRPKAKTKELIRASWVTVALLVIGGVLFGRSAKSIHDIWSWLMMGLGGAFLVPNLLRVFWWRFNGFGSAVGSLVGMTAAVIQRIFWPEMNEFMQLGYSLVAGMVGGIIATYSSKPTDPEVLKDFYMKTRPFGVWGHLKRQLPEAEQKKVTREHFYDLISVPFAMLWQVSMFLAPMLFVIHNWEGFAATMAMFVIGGAGLYWFWYRNLPEDNFYDGTESPLPETENL